MKVCPCHLAVTSCAYTRDPRRAEAAYGPCRPSLAPALATRRQGERPPGAEPSLHCLATPAAHGHPRETLSSHSFQHDPSMKGAKEERAREGAGAGPACSPRGPHEAMPVMLGLRLRHRDGRSDRKQNPRHCGGRFAGTWWRAQPGAEQDGHSWCPQLRSTSYAVAGDCFLDSSSALSPAHLYSQVRVAKLITLQSV